MTISNVSRREMIGGLAAGVSAGSVTSSDTFIEKVRALNPRKRPLFWYPAPSLGLGLGAVFRTGSKSRVMMSLTGVADRSHLLSKDINLDTHIADIANLLEWEDLTDICLVAHSYAGYPASERARTHWKPCIVHRLGRCIEARRWSEIF